MALVALSVMLWAGLASGSTEENAARHADLTIVLDFQGPHSERSVDEMKREFQEIMKKSGLTFDFRSKIAASQETFSNLIVVRFKGKCVLQPVSYLYDERGPLAFTYATEGTPQPFSEVACDRVTALVRSAMFGGEYAQPDLLIGRALARVVVHEMVHVLTQSGTHGHDGVDKPALSGRDLIADELELDPADLRRILTVHLLH